MRRHVARVVAEHDAGQRLSTEEQATYDDRVRVRIERSRGAPHLAFFGLYRT